MGAPSRKSHKSLLRALPGKMRHPIVLYSGVNYDEFRGDPLGRSPVFPFPPGRCCHSAGSIFQAPLAPSFKPSSSRSPAFISGPRTGSAWFSGASFFGKKFLYLFVSRLFLSFLPRHLLCRNQRFLARAWAVCRRARLRAVFGK